MVAARLLRRLLAAAVCAAAAGAASWVAWGAAWLRDTAPPDAPPSAGTAPPARALPLPPAQAAAAAPGAPAPAPPLHGRRVAVVLMSWPGSDRFHRLTALAEEARRWPFTAEVILVWNGAAEQLPAAVAALQRRGVLSVRPQGSNRLDNRWRVATAAEAVLNIDDDVDLRESGAACIAGHWAARGGLVAVDVRAHSDDPSALARARRRAGADSVGRWAYASRHPQGRGWAYSIALPRALVGDSALWGAYAAAPPAVGAVVRELLCDDVAFNFIAANATGRPPLYVRAPFRPFAESQSGRSLQKSKGMKGRRQRCLTELAEVFGGMPLRYRSDFAVCPPGAPHVQWDGESGNHGPRRRR